jgi:CHAD domain-containing protein
MPIAAARQDDMAPRFHKKDKSIEAGLRRMACGQIDKALAIANSAALSPDRRIHKIRQKCKTMRGLIRLVRPVFAGYGPANREFRDISRRLSGTRDAAVLIGTFEDLASEDDGAGALSGRNLAAIRAALKATLDCGDQAEKLLATCVHRLVEAHGHAARWEVGADGWAAIGPGLQQTYRDARQALALTAQGSDPDASHDWRKQVRYHAIHVGMLRPMHPGPLKAREQALVRLGDWLGEAHDMEVLLEAMAAAPGRFGGIVSATTLARLARRRKERLHRKALEAGAALFAEKPRVLVAQWGDWWRAWKAEGD